MGYPTDAGTITPLVDGTDYMEDDNINNVVTELEAVKTLIGTPGAAQSHLATLLDMLADNYTGGRCYGEAGTTDEIYVGIFSGLISNAAGSIRKLRRSASITTLTDADLDTGAMAVGYYYIYATADGAATTPVFVFSASASSPTGYTYYKKIGWFYNETASVLDVTNMFIGNIKDGSANQNIISIIGETDISTTSTSYVDMTDMEIKFVSNGNPVKITFNGNIFPPDGNGTTCYVIIDIDGTDYAPSRATGCNSADAYRQEFPVTTFTLQNLTAGTHTIKTQWKVSGGTGTQYGTISTRTLIVEEL